MNKPTVLVDIDGVVLNFHEGMRQVLEEQGHTYIVEHQTTYSFGGDIGCDKKLIFDNFMNPEVYKKAPLHYMAKESIELLKTVANVETYTSTVPSKEIIEIRRKLCEDELGIKMNRYDIGHKPVVPGVLALFEDCPDNLIPWRDTDTELYLIEHPYNFSCNDRRFIKAYNFHDAVMRFMNRLDRLMETSSRK